MQYKFLFTGVLLFSIARIQDLSLVPSSELLQKDISFHFSKSASPFWDLGKHKAPATDTTSLKQSNWYGEAMKNIAASEYHFKWEEIKNAYCTPNRKNNLRFFYNEDGFSVEPRTTQIPIGDFDPLARPDEIKYKTLPNWKVKFDLDKKQVGKGIWKVSENKAEYITDKITVQYINNEEGMRQNFIVQKPLSKNDELKINLNIKTKLKTVLQNNRLTFIHKKTEEVLRYTDLKVWDAEQKILPAEFIKNAAGDYSIKVNTGGAIYPVTIDPISTTPAIILECNQTDGWMGRSVSSAGDVNGDGYSDVIVGASQFDNGQAEEGAGFVYLGSPNGIISTIHAQLECNQAGAHFGQSVSAAGDVNADGYGDVVVGAENYNIYGAAFVFLGSAIGLSTTIQAELGTNQQALMGRSVSGVGDVNGDGYSDVIVGAPFFGNGQSSEGAVFVYHGSAAGINTTIQAQLESNNVLAQLGYSISGTGDINGDGYSDIIAGAYRYANGQTEEGAVFVYHGSPSGINTVVAAIIQSNQANAWMGNSVSGAGDINGDGYCDILAGTPKYDNGQTDEGVVFVYHGTASGINTTPILMIESNVTNLFDNVQVECAGDVNGDGYSDVLFGVSPYNNGQSSEGAVFVYHGSASGIATTATTVVESNQAGALFGWSVASAGDVNGDGYSDVIAGALWYDNGQTNEGAAFVYQGAPNGLSLLQTRILNPVNQNQAGIGNAVAGAGDVNGDGYSDVIVGAFAFDDGANSDEGRAWVFYGSAIGLSAVPDIVLDDANQAGAYFGYSVAGAGDVNGDGFADIAVGAYSYDESHANEGRAWVHYGSAAGLSVAANRILDDANQDGAAFGISVSGAGDVNGDGYGDVIVGAYSYNDNFTDEGRAYVYYGSAAGLAATPSNTPDDADQATAYFGGWVTHAGDVNGDGYSDVAISASLFDDTFVDEGVVFIYYGGASGLSAAANAILDDGNQAGASFGRLATGAGDVNGDGFSDLLITSILYDGGKGRGWVYYGHAATGLSAVPDVILDNTAGFTSDRFGYGASTAGDVNGDGYSDIIVGMPQRTVSSAEDGQAYIYYGSAAGLPATPSLIIHDATEAHEFFGLSTACAGDINGDGYSDVIVGADHGSWPSAFGGRAYVHNGNDFISNKRNNLRLYNTNLTTPLNSSNFIFGNFGAGLYAKSFLGRAKGKLVWETRINYNAYSGTPITNSTFFTAQQAAYTNLGLAGVELKNLINKINGGRYTKLRARVKYDPVTAITGQVYGPWRNVSSIIDANNLGILPIELISFNAAWLQKGKTSKLEFKTDKESGICCFDIEKSNDGFNFYRIGTLPAKNISGIQSYSFIDGNATNKKQFYRLKIKGIAGQIDYSNIQQLQNNGATEILVFPNPTTDVLQLQLNKVYDKMHVQIVNAAGQIIKQLMISASNQTISIPVQNLAAGQYWIRLQDGGEKQVLQFVKQ